MHHAHFRKHLIIESNSSTTLFAIGTSSKYVAVRSDYHAMSFICPVFIHTNTVACCYIAHILYCARTHKCVPSKQTTVGEIGRD